MSRMTGRTSNERERGSMSDRANNSHTAKRGPRAGLLRDRAGRAYASRGFTLVEIIVAVGAAALVAVGLAAIFDSVGKTVSGGRRLSDENAQIALLEQTLRADFARMTRDGFLVVRQQYANLNGDNTITLAADSVVFSDGADERVPPRPRRIDEIMFFAKGDFYSVREPLDSSYVAQAKAARIYYGHGQRAIPDLADASAYRRPRLNARQNEIAGRLGVRSADNPNQFARDWILLRHVTLLAEPEANPALPERAVFEFNPSNTTQRQRLLDRDTQIALQPAASSIFRTLARTFPDDLEGGRPTEQGEQKTLWSDDLYTGDPSPWPRFSSGTIDIATTSLDEIRRIVTTSQVAPADIGNADDWRNNPPTGSVSFGAGSSTWQQRRDRSHQWMLDALPTWSGWGGTPVAQQEFEGTRMRTEPAAPDYFTVLAADTSSQSEARRAASRRGDQLMLSASNILARCSEFVVEWTFGKFDPSTNEMIWYGGQTTPSGGRLKIAQYLSSVPEQAVLRITREPSGETKQSNQVVSSNLIHPSFPAGLPGATEVTALFGYYDWESVGTNSGDEFDAAAACPWPTMFRITVRFADERDPGLERSFQFLLPGPGQQ
ncbi:MAG: hypothetical protein SFZ23_02345 [Planctomycetota bacterium]|nr:hypothetical protein [Planctomycetota bacterium]